MTFIGVARDDPTANIGTTLQDNITARAGGGATQAVALTGGLCRVTTVASANDSVILPLTTGAPPGSVAVINNGANNLSVYAQSVDSISGGSAGGFWTLYPGQACTFFSNAANKWIADTSIPLTAQPLTQYTSISSGNGTLTGAQMAGAQIVYLLTSGATALTTATAAQILAAIKGGQIGMSYVLRIVNTNAGTLTITADGTITATGTLTIATNTWREWIVTLTSATAATMQQVGTGTTS